MGLVIGSSVKAVILAGGLGTRISEETQMRPKPMVEIGGRPILWHIMKLYSAFGINDFLICCGYKGYVIKEYFSNYALHLSDVTFDLKRGTATTHRRDVEPWTVTLVDTGEQTMTGGRLKRVASFVEDGPFCMTYGDGLASIDIAALIRFHKTQGRLVTVTAVEPPGRFGRLEIANEGRVTGFDEKPHGDGATINGGFFVLEPRALEYIDGDQTIWERDPMIALARADQVSAFRHDGFWLPMDTLRDKTTLESLWASGNAPWKRW